MIIGANIPRTKTQDDFRLIKMKENQDINRTVDDKILLLEKQMVQNESYNDQYLLTNSIENSGLPKNASISFHFQSIDVDKGRSYSKKESIQEFTTKQETAKYQSGNQGDSALMLLLNEFEKRFEQIEDRIEKNEKSHRANNMNSKQLQDILLQFQEKISNITQRLVKSESRLKQLEESFTQHKNQTDKKIIEYNSHIDQSLRSFIDSSLKIQKKIDKLTVKDSGNDVEILKHKVDNIQMNLTKTHDLLTQQVYEFQNMSSQFNQVSKCDVLKDVDQEIQSLKEQQYQTIEYLRQLQECLQN
ncbi:hypothetical protein pb186bvf_012113 [Paramecium bursaria]